jgi:hypothetical protein
MSVKPSSGPPYGARSVVEALDQALGPELLELLDELAEVLHGEAFTAGVREPPADEDRRAGHTHHLLSRSRPPPGRRARHR